MTATIGIPAAPAATTAYNESKCTPPAATNNTDNVLSRSCWILASDAFDDPRIEGYSPTGKLRIPAPPGLDGTKWSRCQVRVAVFWKPSSASSYSRYQTDVWGTEPTAGSESCLPAFQAQSNTNAPVYYHGSPVVIQPRACYYVITRWFGVYDGQAVGVSAYGPFPQSSTLCGPPTGVALVDDSNVTPPDAGDLPGALISVGIPE